MGLITDLTGDLDGIQATAIVSNVEGELRGVQISGVGNSVAGVSRGAQIAGVFNSGEGRFDGGQVAGVFNSAEDDVDGAQVSGVFNVAEGDVQGAQVAGVFNTSEGSVDGVQVSGVFNTASGSVGGAQIGGVFNVADGFLGGFQMAGVFNVAEDMQGLQLGVVNVARDVQGTQIGIVNISRFNRGLPIGLINISADGVSGLTLWSDSRGFTYGGFQFGTRYTYTIIMGGTSANDPWQTMSLGFGIGGHVDLGNFFLEGDISQKIFFTQEDLDNPEGWAEENQNGYPSVRLMGGIKIFDHLALFGGFQMDAWFPDWMDGSSYPLGADEKVEEFMVGDFPIHYVPRWFLGVRI